MNDSDDDLEDDEGLDITPAPVGSSVFKSHQDGIFTLIWRFARRPLFEAAILYAFFIFSSAMAIPGKTSGQLYDLRPAGLGFLIDVFVVVVVLTAFHLFYILPAYFARKSIGIVLKVLMYMIFVVFLAWMHWTKFVAVELNDTSIVLIHHWPQRPEVLRRGSPARLRSTNAVRTLAFLDGTPEGICSVPVYRLDHKTSERIEELALQIGAAEERH